MQRPGSDLLAGARFTLDQDRARHRRDALDHRGELPDGIAHPDQPFDPRPLAHLAPEHIVLACEPRAFEATLDGVEDLVEPERLEDEVGRACPQRVDRGLDISECRDQDDVAVEARGAQLTQPLHPRLAGECDVENDDVEVIALDERCCLFRAGGGFDKAASARKSTVQETAHALFVVHHQYRVLGPRTEANGLRLDVLSDRWRSLWRCHACLLLWFSCAQHWTTRCDILSNGSPKFQRTMRAAASASARVPA